MWRQNVGNLTETDNDTGILRINKALPKAPSHIHSLRFRLWSFYHRRLTAAWQTTNGYRFVILCCALITTVVMIINLTFTIWAVQKFGAPNGLVTLQDGSCKETSTRTTWLHLAINVLSTLLLGASNYAMQCLSSPTRGDVNKAHSRNIWLDIGVPSFRNLRWVSRLRIILWCLLAVSSVPLHFLYNSAIFSTLSVRSFGAAVVSRDYINGAPFSIYVSDRLWKIP